MRVQHDLVECDGLIGDDLIQVSLTCVRASETALFTASFWLLGLCGGSWTAGKMVEWGARMQDVSTP